MNILYSIIIYFSSVIIRLLSVFNSKLKQGVIGRSATFKALKSHIQVTDKTLWFHCASLGEYEQGLPVFEALKTKYSSYKIVLSFFSPSGYEIKKECTLADVVVYLPLDTKANARRFLSLVNPDYIVFVKYEIWPNFLYEIKKRRLKAILISAVFRKEQVFFKWYGGLMRSSLFAFRCIFTQDEGTKDLLETIGYKNTIVSGDTRLDRVTNQLKIDNTVSFIKDFKKESLCIVLGSTWPNDDRLYIDFINKNASSELKFVIAPHNIKQRYINSITSQLTTKTVCYSEKKDKKLSNYTVFVLDTIGYLSKVYSYADIVYVGGASGTTGLHNILEPSVFGAPIIIGENYKKFPEARALVNKKGVASVIDKRGFETIITTLIESSELRKKQGLINKDFVIKHKGAVAKIIDYINNDF